jgi:DNA-binding transcriptional regulator PaaX
VQLLDRVEAVIASLGVGDAGLEPDGFVVGAATLRHVRADPLLPAELLPPDWPGDALRAAYGTYRERFGDAATEWFRRHAARYVETD